MYSFSGQKVLFDLERITCIMKLNPYLNYGGNCAEAFRFYEKHLGGKITVMMTQDQQPDPKNIPPGWRRQLCMPA